MIKSDIQTELDLMLTDKFIKSKGWCSAIAIYEPGGTYWDDILYAFEQLGSTEVLVFGQRGLTVPVDETATMDLFEAMECKRVFSTQNKDIIDRFIALDLAASTVFILNSNISALIYLHASREFHVLAGTKEFLFKAASTNFEGIELEFQEAVFENDDIILSSQGIAEWNALKDYYMIFS